MSAGVTWLGLGFTLGTAGLVTYGLAVLPCTAAVREEDAEPVCRPARRTALAMGVLASASLVVGTVYLVLHATNFG
ncbi:hypothetical protein V2W30_37775 [Streptomyces sp. Q6]|uniref:Uncharacterized protein n=1 Tax=Streptomyces citrinus TaxID=3118173 RepID=A0ACD5AMT5_9ACTN